MKPITTQRSVGGAIPRTSVSPDSRSTSAKSEKDETSAEVVTPSLTVNSGSQIDPIRCRITASEAVEVKCSTPPASGVSVSAVVTSTRTPEATRYPGGAALSGASVSLNVTVASEVWPCTVTSRVATSSRGSGRGCSCPAGTVVRTRFPVNRGSPPLAPPNHTDARTPTKTATLATAHASHTPRGRPRPVVVALETSTTPGSSRPHWPQNPVSGATCAPQPWQNCWIVVIVVCS